MILPIQGPSPTEIRNFAKYLYDKWQQRSREKQLGVATLGRNHPRLFEVLKTLYDNHDFLGFGGINFPVIRIPLPASQIVQPESILGSLSSDRRAHVDHDLSDAGKQYLKLLSEVGRPLMDLPTYCLKSLVFGDELKVNCVLGNYFDALVSCDILEWEVLTEIVRLKATSDLTDFIERNLKLRTYVHQLSKFEDPVLTSRGRSAALSISTLVVFNRGDEYCVLIGERSNSGVAVHGDLYHVAPSGMFQPTVGDFAGEFSILHSFFREYMEELFGLAEAQTPPAAISHDYFYDDANLRFLREMIAANEAQMFLTGFVVNALNLRPEICTMLVIRTPEWFEIHKKGRGAISRIELNEEWKTPNEKAAGKPNVVPVKELGSFGLDFGNVVPPGAAAIILGLEAAASLSLF